MGYEDAPATKMLATRCAVCRKELVDAKSVETGMGPDCRRKHGYEADVSEEARTEGNKLIYEIALHRDDDPELVIAHVNRLMELGYATLVKTLVARLAKVKISTTPDDHLHGPGRYAVKTPWIPDYESANYDMRRVRGTRWDGQNKVRTFPQGEKARVFGVLREWYGGMIGIGPKGLFVIPEKKGVSQAA